MEQAPGWSLTQQPSHTTVPPVLVTVKEGDEPVPAPRRIVHDEWDTFLIEDIIVTMCPGGYAPWSVAALTRTWPCLHCGGCG